MHLIKVDPRALKDNPNKACQTKSAPQADALLLATIKAVGIVQPPVIAPETGGSNGYIIDHRALFLLRPRTVRVDGSPCRLWLCRKLEAEMQNGCLIHFSGCQDFELFSE